MSQPFPNGSVEDFDEPNRPPWPTDEEMAVVDSEDAFRPIKEL